MNLFNILFEMIKNLIKFKKKCKLFYLKWKYLINLILELTIALLQNHIKQKIDPTKLIAGLMDIPKEKREIGITFLKYCIEKLNCKEKTIYNILIFFLSEQENSEPLYDFLKSQEKFLMEVGII